MAKKTDKKESPEQTGDSKEGSKNRNRKGSGRSVKKSGRSFASGFSWGEVDDEEQPEVLIPAKKKRRRGKDAEHTEHSPSTLSAVHTDSDLAHSGIGAERKSWTVPRLASDPVPPKLTSSDKLALPSYGRQFLDPAEEEDEFIKHLLETAEEDEQEEQKKTGNKRRRKKSSKKTTSSTPAEVSEEPKKKSSSGTKVSKMRSDKNTDKSNAESGSVAVAEKKQEGAVAQSTISPDGGLEHGKGTKSIRSSDSKQNTRAESKNEQDDSENISKGERIQIRSRALKALRICRVDSSTLDELARTRNLSEKQFLRRFLDAFLDLDFEALFAGRTSIEDSDNQLSGKGTKKESSVQDEKTVGSTKVSAGAKKKSVVEPIVSDSATENRIRESSDLQESPIGQSSVAPSVSFDERIDTGRDKRRKSKDRRSTGPVVAESPSSAQETESLTIDRDTSSDRLTTKPDRNRRSEAVESIVEPKAISKEPASKELSSLRFGDLQLSKTMLQTLHEAGYDTPTPVQAGTFSRVMAGVDLIGQAKTGTGKTAAFIIPLLEQLCQCDPGNDPVALIIVPTRELAVQVRDEALKLAGGMDCDIVAVYGGKPIADQIKKLRGGVDIVVGTPGRIIDLVSRRALNISALHWVVLDEADRMLDIGFRPDIEKILRQTPKERQTLLFSATLPDSVVHLALKYMQDPEQYDFSKNEIASETIEQFYISVDKERKFDALIRLLEVEKPTQAIVFCRTKRAVDRIGRHLAGIMEQTGMIHGDLAQEARDRIMKAFRGGNIRVLVATDVVGRGIDVSGISHIINYDIPQFCDDYVHRVGRTGRMGHEGVAFTLVTSEEGIELTRIEKRINRLLKRFDLPDFVAYTRPSHDTEEEKAVSKPVYGVSRRIIRRAL